MNRFLKLMVLSALILKTIESIKPDLGYVSGILITGVILVILDNWFFNNESKKEESESEELNININTMAVKSFNSIEYLETAFENLSIEKLKLIKKDIKNSTANNVDVLGCVFSKEYILNRIARHIENKINR